MEKSVVNSEKAAEPIRIIMGAIIRVDIEYLSEALKDMEDNHSMRDSMAVLNPNPFTHSEKQELNSAKLNQLRLIIELAKNVEIIRKCESNLIAANGHQNDMKKIFGM